MGLLTHSKPSARSTPLKRQVSARQAKPLPIQSNSDDEDDLPELASDSAVLYQRRCSMEDALGTHDQVALHLQIAAYVEQRYFHALGLTRLIEPIEAPLQTVPYDAKAPRFISIHAIRRKELERDYTQPPDTTQTCHRKGNCSGRCLFGSQCPPP